MKRSLFVLLSTFLLAGCTTPAFNPTTKTSRITSTSIPTSEPTSESTTSSPTSVPTSVPTTSTPTSSSVSTSTSVSISTSAPTSVSTSTSTPTSTSASTNTSVPTSASTSTPTLSTSETPAITIQKIGTIRSERRIGEYVSFEATYLRKISFVSDAALFFADDTGSISFRIANNIDYINKCYRFKEYKVTGRLTETNGNLEVTYDTGIPHTESNVYRDAVVRLGDDHALSYDENSTTLPTELSSISDIETRAGSLTLDNKSYGYSEQLVKFTAQYVQNENENSSEKTMFVDEHGKSIVVIMDGDGTGGRPLYDLRNTDNFGKFYEITGIISVRYSIPAILGLKAKYVTHAGEGTVNVSDAVEVTNEVATEIFKGNLTTDKFRALSNEYYFNLYRAEGWVVNNDSITTSYNFGLTLTEGGSISDSNTGKNTVKGFYFVNGTSITNLAYCPYDEYLGQKIEVYFKIESYSNNNHIWKIFVIEDLINIVS